MDQASNNANKRRYWTIAIVFAIIKLLLHLFTNSNYELHRDEMLYFNMADHLDFGFATIPPFTGFVAFLVKGLFGYSVWGLRLIPAIPGSLSIFLIAKVIRTIGGGGIALTISSIAFILSGGFLIFNTLFTPNVFEQFFWLLLIYLILRMVQYSKTIFWIPIGIIAGLSFLAKYSIVFFVIGFFLALLISSHRKLIFSRHFFIGLLIFLVIISPNLIWQFQHGWPVAHHMKELKETQLVNMSYTGFLKDLFDLCFLFTYVWIFGLVAMLFSKTLFKFKFLGFGCLFIMLLFFISHGKAYYVLGLIPFLFAIGGYAIERFVRGLLQKTNYALFSIATISSILALPFSLPLLGFDLLDRYHKLTGSYLSYPFSRWEDGKQHSISQVYADMTGWKELARIVSTAYEMVPETERESVTIYAERNYGYAGAVNFYGENYGLPSAITFLESYTIWAPDSIPNGPLIYINKETDDITELFKEIKEVGVVRDNYFRENGLKVYLCNKPGSRVQEIYSRKAADEKQAYERQQKFPR